MTRESLAIGAAVFLVCFGLLAWLLSRRKGDRVAGPALLAGVPGVYLAALPAIAGAPKWLYIPGLLLIAVGYAVQIVIPRRQRAKGDAGPAGRNGPV